MRSRTNELSLDNCDLINITVTYHIIKEIFSSRLVCEMAAKGAVRINMHTPEVVRTVIT